MPISELTLKTQWQMPKLEQTARYSHVNSEIGIFFLFSDYV